MVSQTSTPSPVLVYIALALMAVVTFRILYVALRAVSAAFSSNVPHDPKGDHFVWLDALAEQTSLLDAGTYEVRIYRQSGYIHAFYRVSSGPQATKKALSTFRRRNSSDELYFDRAYRDHRGSSEGKKVGGVEISRVT
jgi:hypothetical protein